MDLYNCGSYIIGRNFCKLLADIYFSVQNSRIYIQQVQGLDFRRSVLECFKNPNCDFF